MHEYHAPKRIHLRVSQHSPHGDTRTGNIQDRPPQQTGATRRRASLADLDGLNDLLRGFVHVSGQCRSRSRPSEVALLAIFPRLHSSPSSPDCTPRHSPRIALLAVLPELHSSPSSTASSTAQDLGHTLALRVLRSLRHFSKLKIVRFACDSTTAVAKRCSLLPR